MDLMSGIFRPEGTYSGVPLALAEALLVPTVVSTTAEHT
jgi:hypothetical protein